MADPMEDAMTRRAAVRAGAQAAAPGVQPAPATASDAPAMSMEDAMVARAKARAGGGAPPIPPPPVGDRGGQTDTQPGFWQSAWKQEINPVPMIQALRELGQQSGQEQEELAKQLPWLPGTQPHEIAREAQNSSEGCGGNGQGSVL